MAAGQLASGLHILHLQAPSRLLSPQPLLRPRQGRKPPGVTLPWPQGRNFESRIQAPGLMLPFQAGGEAPADPQALLGQAGVPFGGSWREKDLCPRASMFVCL